MTSETKAYLVGGSIGSLAAAAFMIRDGNMPGANISILEAAPIMGGSLGSAGDPERGYSVRAAQMAVYELLGISRKIPPSRHTTNHFERNSRPWSGRSSEL